MPKLKDSNINPTDEENEAIEATAATDANNPLLAETGKPGQLASEVLPGIVERARRERNPQKTPK